MAETSSSTSANRSAARRTTASAKRSTAAKKAAATRARNRAAETAKRSTAAKKAAEARRDAQRTPAERYVDLADRAVTIQIGAALAARDSVLGTFSGFATRYSSLDKVERELRDRRRRIETDLRTFERRGSTARTRFERELRRRRERVERDVRGVRRDASAQAGLVGARVEQLVQSGLTAGTQAAARAIERAARAA